MCRDPLRGENPAAEPRSGGLCGFALFEGLLGTFEYILAREGESDGDTDEGFIGVRGEWGFWNLDLGEEKPSIFVPSPIMLSGKAGYTVPFSVPRVRPEA